MFVVHAALSPNPPFIGKAGDQRKVRVVSISLNLTHEVDRAAPRSM